MKTLSGSVRSRPAANAWRNAASGSETPRPISVANVATRIANSELPGNGSGQRIGGRPYAWARRSTSRSPSSRAGPLAHESRSKRLNRAPSRIGCHTGGSAPASSKTRWTRSAARYAYGEPRS